VKSAACWTLEDVVEEVEPILRAALSHRNYENHQKA